MSHENDEEDWNLYASGWDARLRCDPFNPDSPKQWQDGWKDCDAEVNGGNPQSSTEG